MSASDELPFLWSLESPRALELYAIVEDTSRPRGERLQAAQELERLEAVAERRNEAKIRRALEFEAVPTVYDRPTGGGIRKLWPHSECRKHGILGCSQCQPRRRRKPPVARYAELAHEAGWNPKDLSRPFDPGRKSPAQRIADADRRAALVHVVRQLHAEGCTQESIGRALGYTQSAIAKLLRG